MSDRMKDIAERVGHLGINFANELPAMVKDIATALTAVHAKLDRVDARLDALEASVAALESAATAPPKRKG